MKNSLFVFALIFVGRIAFAQDIPEAVDTRQYYNEAREVCFDRLDGFFALLKRSKYCPLYKLAPIYDVFDSSCVIETSSLRDSLILHHPVEEYIIKLNHSKCSIDGPYIDYNFEFQKVNRNAVVVSCIGGLCSVDIAVRQMFDGQANNPQKSYCDQTWKRITFKVFRWHHRIIAKIVYVTAGKPQKC